MVEDISTILNAVVTCVGCQLSFMLTNVDNHVEFKAIISAAKDRTVYIPINTICDKCYLDLKGNLVLGLSQIANSQVKADNVATTLLGNDVAQTLTIWLVSHEIQSILKPATEVAELQVECESAGLNVTTMPHVSGRMLLQFYGVP